MWANATTRNTPVQGVVHDFQPSRAAQAPGNFLLADLRGKLVCDDYAS